MAKKDLITLKDSDWYKGLLEELEAILTTRMVNSRLEVITGKWEIGKAIIENYSNFERFGYGEKAVDIISHDLRMSSSDIYKCIQFYKKYPAETIEEVIMKLPEGNNISWYKICQEYLPEGTRQVEKKPKFIACRVDLEEKVIYIKEKYKDFKIKYN